MARAPKLIRIFRGTNGRVYWHSESRSKKIIDRSAQGNGYKDARYVRRIVADRYPGIKVVDETLSETSAKANATKLSNASIIAAQKRGRKR